MEFFKAVLFERKARLLDIFSIKDFFVRHFINMGLKVYKVDFL
jgi:hypothetical protein